MEGGAESIACSLSLTEMNDVSGYLDAMCSYYMLIGVSYDEFWHGDYTRLKFYIEAHNLRRQKQSEEMWLQGLYFFNALSTALSNLNLDGKRRKPNKYIEEPLRLIPMTESEKRIKAEKDKQAVIDYFTNLERKFKSKNNERK